MKTFKCAVLLVGLVLGLAQMSAAAGVKWGSDLAAAVKSAGDTSKPVLALFTSANGACELTTPQPFKDDKVIALAASFVCVKVDADDEKDLVAKYGTKTYPTTVFMDTRGEAFGMVSDLLTAEAYLVRMHQALGLWKVLPEVEKLTEKQKAGTASGPELARLGHILMVMNRSDAAMTALNAAAAVVPEDVQPWATGVALDRLILKARTGAVSDREALAQWIADHPQDARRWDAQFRLGTAQRSAKSFADAASTFTEVAQGTPTTDLGVLAKCLAQLSAADVKTGGKTPT